MNNLDRALVGLRVSIYYNSGETGHSVANGQLGESIDSKLVASAPLERKVYFGLHQTQTHSYKGRKLDQKQPTVSHCNSYPSKYIRA